MTPVDKEALIGLYEKRYEEIGHDVRTLGWRGQEDQNLRFEILCDIGDLSGASICDVGCGFGDLVAYLQKRFGDFEYTGLDMSPSIAREASQSHPQYDFRCVEMLGDGFSDRFDYFLLSGALNFRIADNWKFTSDLLRLMFKLANKGIAVNFLSAYVTHQREHNYHHSPEDVFSLARSLTRWVTLRHDYPLWEFTIYLYKDSPL